MHKIKGDVTMNDRIYKHQCKDCDARFYIEDLKLVSVSTCPKCNGDCIYVGEHKIEQHDKDLWTEQDKPLLTIELHNESSVPKVFYKGEEVTRKTNITFDWEQDSDTFGGLTYAIERYISGEGVPVKERLERHANGHAT